MYFELDPVFREAPTCSEAASLEKQINETLRFNLPRVELYTDSHKYRGVEGPWPLGLDLGLNPGFANHGLGDLEQVASG